MSTLTPISRSIIQEMVPSKKYNHQALNKKLFTVHMDMNSLLTGNGCPGANGEILRTQKRRRKVRRGDSSQQCLSVW